MQENTPGSPQPPGAGQPDPEPASPFGGSVDSASDVNPPADSPPPPPPPPPPPAGFEPPSGPTGDVPPPPPPPPPTDVPGNSLNPKLVIAIIVAVLLIVAIAAYFLFKKPAPAPVVIPQATTTPSPSPTSSLNPSQQIATLKPVTGKSGSGEASRSNTPGRFVLTVTAQLPDPGQGKFYEVWLVRPTPAAQFSAGQLKQSGNRWVLTLDQTRDATAFSNVMVTLETVEDSTPETKILTGSFQQ